MKNQNVSDMAARFQIGGTVVSVAPYGNGHINDTYVVDCAGQGGRVCRYILQRINHHIFKDVPALMTNIIRTTGHIRERVEREGQGDIDRRVLRVVPSAEGDDFLQDERGDFWRMYIFITGARTYDAIQSPQQAFEVARAFGRFQVALADLPAPRLHETIPAFHHTRSRFEALTEAVRRDSHGRVESASEEISFALGRESLVDVLLNHQQAGDIPERITHNDTKLNNVMIDDVTGEGICVIDLDTIMPGLALYDFGDMVRTATNTGAEDGGSLSRVSSDMGLFEALVKGYLEATGNVLTAAEKSLLAFSGRLITFEIGIRFLTDYLSGDTYFKTHREGHNLDRCRSQFRLLTSLEDQQTAMQHLVDRCA